MTTNKSFLQPLDRLAIALMLVLSLLIGLVLSQGDVVKPRVRNFSWQNEKIGVEDTSFTLTFSRPMDTKSVEENLKIEPLLPGKISWAGRRMVYTLLGPAPYGTTYKVQLQSATDKFADAGAKRRAIQPFTASFSTRDRALAYIGIEGEEQGRLILYNFNSEEKKILTPKNLAVLEFKPYPDGEKILFSASERTSQPENIVSAQLYSVTTGVQSQPEKPAEPAGKTELILDAKDYQNLKFDLSADGQTIVIQRVSKVNPSDFGMWFLSTNSDNQDKPTPKRLQAQPGGDFIITPDSQAVAVAQGQGVAILPLQADATKPLDFLGQFGVVQAFSRDGSQAVMVKFNTDYTRGLFLVTNQGVQKQLLKTTGSILSCQFDNASPTLYCLLTQLLEGEQYQEQPYVAAIDLKTGQQKALVVLPNQRDVQMSLSPDGLALLFDQLVTEPTSAQSSDANTLFTDDGEAIVSSKLWLVPLLPAAVQDAGDPAQMQPEPLPLSGLHPRWLP